MLTSELNNLLNMVCDTSLDMGVRKHLARALRQEVHVITQDVLGVAPRKDQMTAEEIHAGRYQGKVPAIKMLRDRTGLSLLESKTLVEQIFDKKGYKFFSLSTTYPNY